MQDSDIDRKRFKAIGHTLKPVIIISHKGLSANISNEIDRALSDHELIKIKVDALEKVDRVALAADLARQTDATVVQNIGKVAVLYRKNLRANPKLSNVSRFLG